MNWDQLPEIIGAVAALGTAAFGLVDVTKSAWLKMGNSGFGFIEASLKPFSQAMAKATGADWKDLLWSHWVNGRETAEQKSIAKSLVRMGMDDVTAPAIAQAVNVDGTQLTNAVINLRAGAALSQAEVNLLGRVDSAIDARLDAAFERADRRYRSYARNIAALYALVLAVVAGAALYKSQCGGATPCDAAAQSAPGSLVGFFGSQDLVLSIIVGLVAVPLAPISKDLVSGLKAAMSAVKATRG